MCGELEAIKRILCGAWASGEFKGKTTDGPYIDKLSITHGKKHLDSYMQWNILIVPASLALVALTNYKAT